MTSVFETRNLAELGKSVLVSLPFEVKYISSKHTIPVLAFFALFPEVLEQVVEYSPEIEVGWKGVWFHFKKPSLTMCVLWDSDTSKQVRYCVGELYAPEGGEREFDLFLLDKFLSLGLPRLLYVKLRSLVTELDHPYVKSLFSGLRLAWNEKKGWIIDTSASGLVQSPWKRYLDMKVLDLLKRVLNRQDLTYENAPKYLYNRLFYPLKKWLSPEKVFAISPIGEILKLAEKVALLVPAPFFEVEI